MQPTMNKSSWRATVILAAASMTIVFGAAPGIAQETGDLFINVGRLTRSDGSAIAGPVAISNDHLVVGSEGAAYVFARTHGADDWHETTVLAPRDGGPGFGRSVALDDAIAVIGADAAAYVFRRTVGSPEWVEVARLSGDVNTYSFGSVVSVHGSTIAVGAPVGNPPPDLGPGLVYVFERNPGSADTWSEVARLAGAPHPHPGMQDGFGGSLTLEGTTIVVGAISPTGTKPAWTTNFWTYVFSRTGTAEAPWSLSSTFLAGMAQDGFGNVASSGDTIIAVAYGAGVGSARIFQRTGDGVGTWEETALLSARNSSDLHSIVVAIDGDLAAVSEQAFHPRPPGGGVVIFARNEGGQNGWGEVAQFRPDERPSSGSYLATVTIDGDTLVLGQQVGGHLAPALDVLVRDTDRDGVRDGADPCPRDPLNNVSGGCQRDSSASAVLDDLVTLDSVEVESAGQPFVITATFTNSSDAAIRNPFFEVAELSEGNALANADAGPGGVSASLSPDVGDGLLSPGESMTVTFVIDLGTTEPFAFRVNLRGEVIP